MQTGTLSLNLEIKPENKCKLRSMKYLHTTGSLHVFAHVVQFTGVISGDWIN